MSYLLSHWRGLQSIGVSFWINFLGGLALLSFIELTLLSKLQIPPDKLLFVVVASLIFSRLVIFPWQLVGLFRAAERDYLETGHSIKTRGIQAIGLLSVMFTLVYSLEVIQGAVYFKHQLERHAEPTDKDNYSLTLSRDGTVLTVSGDIAPGITQAVSVLVQGNAELKTVILQSAGGHIYEGRGLAKVFMKHTLETRVLEECSSACTTAFMGGIKRSIGSSARLGFHQYKVGADHIKPFANFYNIPAEQQRDRALFESRGVAKEFLDNMFKQDARSIWFPEHSALLRFNIIDSIISAE